jgi:hypothetical protein
VTVHLTPAEARRLGLDTTPARKRTTRKEATGPYHTRCTKCGDEFTSVAAENRHLDADPSHLNYLCVIERLP